MLFESSCKLVSQLCNLLYDIHFIADCSIPIWPHNPKDMGLFKVDDYIDPVSNKWRVEVNIEVALPTSGSILLCSLDYT